MAYVWQSRKQEVTLIQHVGLGILQFELEIICIRVGELMISSSWVDTVFMVRSSRKRNLFSGY